MSDLLSNGKHLYRYSGHLLRTPLRKSLHLTPVQFAEYSIAGAFVQNIPTRGFVASQPHYTQAAVVEQQMRQTYLGQIAAQGPIIWRVGNYDAGAVLYMGMYSSSTAQPYPEAYGAFPAYRFQLPSKYQGWSVESCTLNVTCGGSIFQYGSPQQTQSNVDRKPVFAANAATWLCSANSDLRGPTYYYTGFYSQLTNPAVDMYAASTDVLTAPTTNQGTLNNGAQNCRPYWISWPSGPVSYADGMLPVTNNPWTASAAMGADFRTSLATLMDGWVPLMYPIDANAPYWSSSDSRAAGFWFCDTAWGATLDVTLSLGD